MSTTDPIPPPSSPPIQRQSSISSMLSPDKSAHPFPKNSLGLGLPSSSHTYTTPSNSIIPTGSFTLAQFPHLAHYINNLLTSLHSSPVKNAQHPLAVSSSGESDGEDTPPNSQSRDELAGELSGGVSSPESITSQLVVEGISKGVEGKTNGLTSRRVSKAENIDKDELIRKVVELLDEEKEEDVKELLRPLLGDLAKDEVLMEQVCLDLMHKRRDDQDHVPYHAQPTPSRSRIGSLASSSASGVGLRPYTPTRLPSYRSGALTPLGRPQSPLMSGVITPTASHPSLSRSNSVTKLPSRSNSHTNLPTLSNNPSSSSLSAGGNLSAKATIFNPSPKPANASLAANTSSSNLAKDPSDIWRDSPSEPIIPIARTNSPFLGGTAMGRTGSNIAIAAPLFSDQSSPFHSPMGTPNRPPIKMPDFFSPSTSPPSNKSRQTHLSMERTNSSKGIIPDDDDDDEFSPFGSGLPRLHHHEHSNNSSNSNDSGNNGISIPAFNIAAKPFEPSFGSNNNNAKNARIDFDNNQYLGLEAFGSSSTLSSSIPQSSSSRGSFTSLTFSDNQDEPSDSGGEGMTPLDVLHQVFTGIPKVELEAALHQNGYDFENTMSYLVAQYTLPKSGSSTPQRVNSPRPLIGIGNNGYHRGIGPGGGGGGGGSAGMIGPAGGYFERGGRGNGYHNNFGGQQGGGVGGGTGFGTGNGAVRTPSGVKMCRYFLNGECRRSDCKFSHDLDRALCRFWLRGNCAKGPNCEFLHQLPPNLPASFDPHALSSAMSRLELSSDGSYDSYSGTHSPARTPHEENFPDLSGTRFRAAGKFDPSRNRFANALKRPVPSHPAQQHHIQITGNRMAGLNASTSSSSNLHASSVSIENSPPRPSGNIQPKPSIRIKLRPPTLLPTIKTGSTVNDQYLTLRSTAIQLGHARNACLARAADAFRRGDGAAAKRFSREGKSLNEKMLQESQDAAYLLIKERLKDIVKSTKERDGNWSDDALDRSERGRIIGGGLGVCLGVASRNKVGGGSGDVLSSDERMEVVIDLHTLHGSEAVEVLSQFLHELERENYRGLTYVLVGEEKHVGQADPLRGTSKTRLGNSVKGFLTDDGYSWMDGQGWLCVDSCH